MKKSLFLFTALISCFNSFGMDSASSSSSSSPSSSRSADVSSAAAAAAAGSSSASSSATTLALASAAAASMAANSTTLPAETVSMPKIPTGRPQRSIFERTTLALSRSKRDIEDMAYGVENTVYDEMVIKEKFRQWDSLQSGDDNVHRLTCALKKLMSQGDVDRLNKLLAQSKNMTSWHETESMIWDEIHPTLQQLVETFIRERVERAARRHQRDANVLLAHIPPQTTTAQLTASTAGSSPASSSPPHQQLGPPPGQ